MECALLIAHISQRFANRIESRERIGTAEEENKSVGIRFKTHKSVAGSRSTRLIVAGRRPRYPGFHGIVVALSCSEVLP
jgi:hypothetical protein